MLTILIVAACCVLAMLLTAAVEWAEERQTKKNRRLGDAARVARSMRLLENTHATIPMRPQPYPVLARIAVEHYHGCQCQACRGSWSSTPLDVI